MQNGVAGMENSMRYLQKLKTISYDLDTYPDE
jgi:hypothetical protein